MSPPRRQAANSRSVANEVRRCAHCIEPRSLPPGWRAAPRIPPTRHARARSPGLPATGALGQFAGTGARLPEAWRPSRWRGSPPTPARRHSARPPGGSGRWRETRPGPPAAAAAERAVLRPAQYLVEQLAIGGKAHRRVAPSWSSVAVTRPRYSRSENRFRWALWVRNNARSGSWLRVPGGERLRGRFQRTAAGGRIEPAYPVAQQEVDGDGGLAAARRTRQQQRRLAAEQARLLARQVAGTARRGRCDAPPAAAATPRRPPPASVAARCPHWRRTTPRTAVAGAAARAPRSFPAPAAAGSACTSEKYSPSRASASSSGSSSTASGLEIQKRGVSPARCGARRR